MQRNLFEIFQTKVQTLLKESEEPIHIEDLENIEIYIKTAELMLKAPKENNLALHNLIIALIDKKIGEQQKKLNPIENKTEVNKPKEIKHQNMTLEFVKQMNELNKQNKELKDKNFKINEEMKEVKNTLHEKNKEIENAKKQIELTDIQIEEMQKHIQELLNSKKPDDTKTNEQIEKKEIEKIITKHKTKTAKPFGSWSFTRTVSKLDSLLNQDKTNPYVSKNAIKNCMISSERIEFFQNPPTDRSKISQTEKFICELSDTCSKKSSV